MFADSLPDVFGNHLFQSWLNAQGKPIQLNALEQLAYVGQRGMGAWEYEPAITMDAPSSFRIAEMAQLLSEILAKSSLISTECRKPSLPIALSMEILKAPEPTPASKTLTPGLISATPRIIAASFG